MPTDVATSRFSQAASMSVGRYEIVFQAGRYFRESGIALADPAFLEEVPIRFGIADASAHYHVPLARSRPMAIRPIAGAEMAKEKIAICYGKSRAGLAPTIGAGS